MKRQNAETDTEGLMTAVRVRAPFQVGHDGDTFGPGDTVTVDPETAASWSRHGWVDPVG